MSRLFRAEMLARAYHDGQDSPREPRMIWIWIGATLLTAAGVGLFAGWLLCSPHQETKPNE